MNRLDITKRAAVIAALVEGNSIRATVRMTGVAKNTVVKLLVQLGAACSDYQDWALRNLKLKRIQCDEAWSFIYAKEKNVTTEMLEHGHAGDVWTWVAIDAETKLVPCWMVGSRDANTAKAFISDLASRLATRVQLTTDGHKAYLNAVEGAFGCDVDYAMLIKLYGNEPEAEVRYSPAQCIGSRTEIIAGRPEPEHISTSYVERQNLTMRMSMRRFTRLTNAFSKKIENHAAAIALHYMHYNFCRIHQTLRVTPAMEAGVTDHVWSIGEVVALLGAGGIAPESCATRS
jgi:IS1 family transposase